MIKLDKERIRQIALNEFHAKYHESIYDVWTDALQAWLGEMGYAIVTKKDADIMAQARLSARDHMELSRGYKIKKPIATGEASSDDEPAKSEDSTN